MHGRGNTRAEYRLKCSDSQTMTMRTTGSSLSLARPGRHTKRERPGPLHAPSDSSAAHTKLASRSVIDFGLTCVKRSTFGSSDPSKTMQYRGGDEARC